MLDRLSRASYIRTPFLTATAGRLPSKQLSRHLPLGESMASPNESRSKVFFRPVATGAFDQYLQDIQKLPMITDPAEEKRLAPLGEAGDRKVAGRVVNG